jgi:pyridoxal phosphate enzyme (YggS family)
VGKELMMDPDDRIAKNISSVMQRISTACQACGRDPRSVHLVAAAKGQPATRVCRAVDAGVEIVGENYIQEAQSKFEILSASSIRWHFIGRLQSNKAKYAVRMFELIHSVDSVRLAAELDRQARKVGKTQRILVQVNISRETTKAGVEQEQAIELLRTIETFPNIRVQGLMTMPPYFDAPERARPYFAALRRLRDLIQQTLGLPLADLSMGMTGDFEAAIEEGATLVRIGTAIFGDRR